MQRIVSLDYARGFTVLIMAPVHTVLLYGNNEVHAAWLGWLLSLVAECHGAPVLMTLTGIGIALKKHQPITGIILRSGFLLLLAYLLNIAKFLFPLAAFGLPAAFLNDLQVSPGNQGLLQLFLTGDILHFAAIGYFIVSFIARIQHGLVVAIQLLIIIILFSSFMYGGANYFTGGPPRVYFPVFPWLIYPLLGLLIGYAIKSDMIFLFAKFLRIGAGCVLVGIVAKLIGPASLSFYQPAAGDCIITSGLVLLSLYGWHYVSMHVRANKFLMLLELLSKNITLSYCVQWIIICWLLPWFGYHQLGLGGSLLAVLLTTVLTLILTLLFSKTTIHAKKNI